MPTTFLKLIPNPDWPAIADRVLSGEPQARAIMWMQVGFFVERIANLPLGPLTTDEDARRDIALKVLSKLEANDRANLREWRNRQLRQQDHASWWTLVRSMSRRIAIDYARTCKRNVGRRGAPFEWIDEQPVDPYSLAASLDGQLSSGGIKGVHAEP